MTDEGALSEPDASGSDESRLYSFSVPPPPRKPDPSLMNNLGSFFGEIIKGIKTDPAAPRTTQLNQTEQSQPVQTPLGPAVATTRTTDEVAVTPAQNGNPAHVTARRTTVEEVTLPIPPRTPPSVPPST